jgi:hypothetical protein
MVGMATLAPVVAASFAVAVAAATPRVTDGAVTIVAVSVAVAIEDSDEASVIALKTLIEMMTSVAAIDRYGILHTTIQIVLCLKEIVDELCKVSTAIQSELTVQSGL